MASLTRIIAKRNPSLTSHTENQLHQSGMPVPLTKESEVDVLIIGAGPSGLMAANALRRAEVNVRIIDQRCYEVSAVLDRQRLKLV